MNVYSLNIGLTNRCNSKCFFCPIAKTRLPREDMSLELAEKILREADIEHHVSLALFGESTLNPILPEVIKMVKRKGLKAILYTNGIYDNVDLSGLDKVIFSLDAFGREEYKRIKGVDRYEKVLENIKKSKVHTTVQYADLHYAKKDNIPVANKVKFGRFITWGGKVEYAGTKKRVIRKPLPCTHIFRYMNIASNGDMVLCCLDYDHEFGIGNVKDNHVMDVWNGERFSEIRQQQLRGEFSDMCLNCENENYYRSPK